MSSEDSDDDFAPIIPPPACGVKRARSEENEVVEPKPVVPDTEHAKDEVEMAVHQLEAERLHLTAQCIPTAQLYERCFTHSPGHPIHDLAVLSDPLGALVFTVDDVGVLRMWRKLPRGLLFLGPMEGLLPPPDSSAALTRYTIHTDSDMQWILVISVAEYPTGPTTTTNSHDEVAATMEVRVQVRRIHPSSMTVEARRSASFVVAVRKDGVGRYTTRPCVLQHHYAPVVAFFTGNPSSTTMEAASAAGGGASTTTGQPLSGAVLLECGNDDAPTSRRGEECVSVQPTPVSTAHQVMRCAPLPRLGRSGGADLGAVVVLVDAAGVVDYASLGARADGSGLELRIFGGLASCRPNTREAQLWRPLVRFARRQQADFFRILRDAQLPRGPSTGGSALPDLLQALPCAAMVADDGQHFVVISLRLTGNVRTSSGPIHMVVEVAQRVYLFHTAMGTCKGVAETIIGSAKVHLHPSMVGTTSPSSSAAADLIAAVKERAESFASTSSVGIQLIGTSSLAVAPQPPRAGLLILVPNFLSEDLHEMFPAEDGVDGADVRSLDARNVAVYEADLNSSSSSSSSHATTSERTSARKCELIVGCQEERLYHLLHGPPPPAQADPLRPVGGGVGHRGVAAPLALLRRAVVASQGLRTQLTHSVVGQTLTPDDLKQLLGFSTGEGDGGPVVDGLLLTTNMHQGDEMLIYAAGSTSVEGLVAAGPPTQPPPPIYLDALADFDRARRFACDALLHRGEEEDEPPQPNAPHNNNTATNVMASEDVPSEVVGPTASATEVAGNDPATAVLAGVRELLRPAIPGIDELLPWTGRPDALIHVRGSGTVAVRLFACHAPRAVQNFVRLAQRGYFRHLTFHRVVPRAIVQGGCPRGDGTAGESAFDGGAAFGDEGLHVADFFSHAEYSWLCMANAGPNTNASQFFFTVAGGEAMPWLNGHHTVFGVVVSGAECVERMSEVPRDEETDRPWKPLVMERVDVLSER